MSKTVFFTAAQWVGNVADALDSVADVVSKGLNDVVHNLLELDDKLDTTVSNTAAGSASSRDDKIQQIREYLNAQGATDNVWFDYTKVPSDAAVEIAYNLLKVVKKLK